MGKKGEYKAKVLGKYKEWETNIGKGELLAKHEGDRLAVFLRVDTGKGWLTGHSEESNNFRWADIADIKDRVAYERSESKRLEDEQMYQEAGKQPMKPF